LVESVGLPQELSLAVSAVERPLVLQGVLRLRSRGQLSASVSQTQYFDGSLRDA
jgi:hypothetical protein